MVFCTGIKLNLFWVNSPQLAAFLLEKNRVDTPSACSGVVHASAQKIMSYELMYVVLS
jgi:hypothetical protein